MLVRLHNEPSQALRQRSALSFCLRYDLYYLYEPLKLHEDKEFRVDLSTGRFLHMISEVIEELKLQGGLMLGVPVVVVPTLDVVLSH